MCMESRTYRKYSVIILNSCSGKFRTTSTVAASADEARLRLEKSLPSLNDRVVSVYPHELGA